MKASIFISKFIHRLRRPNLLEISRWSRNQWRKLLSDTAPEEKAAELQVQSDIHYKHAALVSGD